MQIYSTCAGCGQVMQVIEENQRAHPGCSYTPDLVERLTEGFVAACAADDTARAAELERRILALDNAPPRLGEAALIYASWGWPVFPLTPGTKVPLPRTRGFLDATCDPQRIRTWWRTHPRANIGVRTGIKFDVLDVDVRHGGVWAWADIRDTDDLPAAHGIATTPSGGLHVLLRPTGGGNKAGFQPGLDYRGKGGYVVVAPSVLTEYGGARYRWAIKPSPVLTGQVGRSAA